MADLARSLTTLIEGIILLVSPGLNGAFVDSVSAVVVCSFIAAGALGAIYTWTKEVRVFWVGEIAAPEYSDPPAEADGSSSYSSQMSPIDGGSHLGYGIRVVDDGEGGKMVVI